MHKLTEAWLRKINEEYRKREVPSKQRPWLALLDWAKHTGDSISFGDEIAKEIFNWFEKNSKVGSQYIGPMYVGALYYDQSFWPVFIPTVFGMTRLNARDSLKTMPDSTVLDLFANRHELSEYVAVWVNCVDYALGVDDLKGDALNDFTRELLAAGDQKLKATVTLLLQDQLNSSAIESARMATEMFLKAFLAAKDGLTERDAKYGIRHDLEKALKRCVAKDPASELRGIQSDLKIFPSIDDRYKGTDQPRAILCRGYEIAQFTGTTICRSLSGRDTRKTLRIR